MRLHGSNNGVGQLAQSDVNVKYCFNSVEVQLVPFMSDDNLLKQC